MTDKTMREAVTAHLNSIDPVEAALLAGFVARELKPLATQMGGEVASAIKHASRIATNLGREGLAELKRDELAGLLAVASNALGSFAEHGAKVMGGGGANNVVAIAKLASAHCARTKLIAFDIPDSNRSIGFGSVEVDIPKNMDARLNTDVAEATAYAGQLQIMLSEVMVEEFNKSQYAEQEGPEASAQKVIDALGTNSDLIVNQLGEHELHDSNGRLLVTLLNRSAKVLGAAEKAGEKFGLRKTRALAQAAKGLVDSFGQTDNPVPAEEIEEKVKLLEEYRERRAAKLAELQAQEAVDAPDAPEVEDAAADDDVISAEGHPEGPVDDQQGFVAHPQVHDDEGGPAIPGHPYGR